MPTGRVLMSILPPRRSDIECTSRLKELSQGTRVLILTLVSDDERIFLALHSGAYGYLLKSTSPAELPGSLRELLKRGAPMTGAAAHLVVSYLRRPSKQQD